MGAGLVPLQVKKHRTDHDRDEENHGAVGYRRLETRGPLRNLPGGCGIVRSRPAVVSGRVPGVDLAQTGTAFAPNGR